MRRLSTAVLLLYLVASLHTVTASEKLEATARLRTVLRSVHEQRQSLLETAEKVPSWDEIRAELESKVSSVTASASAAIQAAYDLWESIESGEAITEASDSLQKVFNDAMAMLKSASSLSSEAVDAAKEHVPRLVSEMTNAVNKDGGAAMRKVVDTLKGPLASLARAAREADPTLTGKIKVSLDSLLSKFESSLESHSDALSGVWTKMEGMTSDVRSSSLLERHASVRTREFGSATSGDAAGIAPAHQRRLFSLSPAGGKRSPLEELASNVAASLVEIDAELFNPAVLAGPGIGAIVIGILAEMALAVGAAMAAVWAFILANAWWIIPVLIIVVVIIILLFDPAGWLDGPDVITKPKPKIEIKIKPKPKPKPEGDPQPDGRRPPLPFERRPRRRRSRPCPESVDFLESAYLAIKPFVFATAATFVDETFHPITFAVTIFEESDTKKKQRECFHLYTMSGGLEQLQRVQSHIAPLLGPDDLLFIDEPPSQGNWHHAEAAAYRAVNGKRRGSSGFLQAIGGTFFLADDPEIEGALAKWNPKALMPSLTYCNLGCGARTGTVTDTTVPVYALWGVTGVVKMPQPTDASSGATISTYLNRAKDEARSRCNGDKQEEIPGSLTVEPFTCPSGSALNFVYERLRPLVLLADRYDGKTYAYTLLKKGNQCVGMATTNSERGERLIREGNKFFKDDGSVFQERRWKRWRQAVDDNTFFYVDDVSSTANQQHAEVKAWRAVQPALRQATVAHAFVSQALAELASPPNIDKGSPDAFVPVAMGVSRPYCKWCSGNKQEANAVNVYGDWQADGVAMPDPNTFSATLAKFLWSLASNVAQNSVAYECPPMVEA